MKSGMLKATFLTKMKKRVSEETYLQELIKFRKVFCDSFEKQYDIIKTRTCKTCKKKFFKRPLTPEKKFCSDACKSKNYRKNFVKAYNKKNSTKRKYKDFHKIREECKENEKNN